MFQAKGRRVRRRPVWQKQGVEEIMVDRLAGVRSHRVSQAMGKTWAYILLGMGSPRGYEQRWDRGLTYVLQRALWLLDGKWTGGRPG